MKKLTLLLVMLAGVTRGGTLEEDFRAPSIEARPYVWWHWLGPNFSKEGITKDLEAMKASGIGGATIFNITSSVMESHAPTENNPWPDQTYRSPKYWEAIRHAAEEAKRLGMEIGLHNTVGYSTTGGPWIDESRSMRRLYGAGGEGTLVKGGKVTTIQLKLPFMKASQGWGGTGRQFDWVKWSQDVVVLAIPQKTDPINLGEVLDISTNMAPDGKLTWSAPEGDWRVFRIVSAPIGMTPHPVPDDVIGKTLEADKMSLEQTKFHWQQVIDPLKKHLGSLYGTTFKHFLIDSYEAGNQNWTPEFRAEFKRLKGYDILPWLVTCGRTVSKGDRGKLDYIVGDPEQTARFEWDYQDAIKTLFFENGWKPAKEMMNADGVELQFEPYSGPFDSIAGAGLADVPMVEFWTGHGVFVNRNILGSARAMGRRVLGAEAFTGAPGNSKWNETPGWLKSCADGAYVGGVNRLTLHHWVHQPFDDRYQPGLGMGWWGTHFNRHQTWFEPGKEFFRYLGRCQALLQRGETPVPYVSVDSQTANGDSISLSTFLNEVTVKDGEIVVAGGRRYRFLHVPHGGKMLPETAARIEQLLRAGATIVSPKPSKSPSLSNYPACDEQIKQIAARVWGDGKASAPKVGAGTLFTNFNDAVKKLNITPAFEVKDAKAVRVIHRADRDAQWFFVANQDAKLSASFTVSFAVTGLQPELWDAELGTIAPATSWRINGAACEVDLKLDAEKSVFVVFRSPTTATASAPKIVAAPAVPETLAISGAWQLECRPVMAKPFLATLDTLASLAEQTNPALKYFSGTAVYRKTVTIPASLLAKGGKIFLDLGDVRNLATVTVNEKSQGVWWHRPYARDVAGALKAGENTLEIAVANTWHNRLVGDEQEPADFEWGRDRGENGHMMKGYPEWFLKNQPRPSQGRKGFVVWYYHRPDSKLEPSGLIGPVKLIAGFDSMFDVQLAEAAAIKGPGAH